MQRKYNPQLTYWLLVLPALLAMAAFYFYPVSRVLWMSVTIPEPGLDNFDLLRKSHSINRMLLTTLRISLISTALTLILGYIVAYVITHAEDHRKRLLFMAVLASLWISVLVRAFAWFTLLRSDGLINQMLMRLGVIDAPLPMMWNEFSVLVGIVHAMLPLAILPLYSCMQSIDPRLIAAARGLGASRLRAFWQVFFPLTLPGVFGASILVFIYALGFYVTPALLGGGRKMMIAEYIKVQILEVVNWGAGSMLASLLLIFIIVTLAIVSRIVDLRKLFGAA
ncbi:ABC transporter permease [Roseovarius sp. PS-C2]|nr:ABC transporter permease [Roseovarius sp. PS-C2]